MPEHENLVSYLLDRGYTDVWSLDFRMSNRFGYNLHRHRYTMDDIALFDHPAALAEVRRHIGSDRRVHVICHCLGSMSFTMSLFAKAVEGVRSVIANSVALTPRVPGWSKLKLMFGPFLAESVCGFEYINPYWRREPGISLGKLFAMAIDLFHHECDSPECHMLSFLWGTGFPALYNHENLLDITHRRGGDLYGGTSVNYHRHVRKMVQSHNTAVKYDPSDPRLSALPNDYFQYARDIETPILFVTGERNNVFRDSNLVCHERLQKIAPGRHELRVFPNYGHQDVFMGKDVSKDIFPHFVEYLDRQRGSRVTRGPHAAMVSGPAAATEVRS
jgi:cholesterol oxidase